MQTALGIGINEYHHEDAALCGRLKTSYNTAQFEEDGPLFIRKPASEPRQLASFPSESYVRSMRTTWGIGCRRTGARCGYRCIGCLPRPTTRLIASIFDARTPTSCYRRVTNTTWVARRCIARLAARTRPPRSGVARVAPKHELRNREARPPRASTTNSPRSVAPFKTHAMRSFAATRKAPLHHLLRHPRRYAHQRRSTRVPGICLSACF